MKSLLVILLFLPVAVAFAETGESLNELELHERLTGDVGGAVYASTNPVRGTGNTALALPYLYCDYGRLFARFDTFGVKTLQLGYGYLELQGRINLDGYDTNTPVLRGVNARRDSVPLGIGTFQETPIGGFFLNTFYDTNQSHGSISELIYAVEFQAGAATFYPMAGVEHFSARYTQYFYGVSAAEASRSVYPTYTPGASTTRMYGLVWELPVAQDWNVDLYAFRRRLGHAITRSPLVNTRVQDEAFLSLSYRYK